MMLAESDSLRRKDGCLATNPRIGNFFCWMFGCAFSGLISATVALSKRELQRPPV